MRIGSPASLLRPAKSSKNKHAHKLVLEGELAVVIERRWEARGYVLSIETFWPVTSEKYNEGPETRPGGLQGAQSQAARTAYLQIRLCGVQA